MTEVHTLTQLFQPIGLVLILVVAYGYLSRMLDSDTHVDVAMGTFFGLAAMTAMNIPVVLGEGVIVDMRNVFVAVSAALFGWRAILITIGIAVATRYHIGGTGTVPAILALSIAATMGAVWAKWVAPRISNQLLGVLALGTMLSAHLVAAFLLPLQTATTFLSEFGLILVAINLVGTGILALMVIREQNIVCYESQLELAATTDPLTNTLNRETVMTRYDELPTAKHADHGTAVLCIDIDHFKAVNDTHGHLIGDQLLVGICDRIRSCLRPHDQFARMSGDEFLIVLSEVSYAEADAVAERCRVSIARKPIDCGSLPIPITISLGSAWTKNACEFDQHRVAADSALYDAKEKGRDRVELYRSPVLPKAA